MMIPVVRQVDSPVITQDHEIMIHGVGDEVMLVDVNII